MTQITFQRPGHLTALPPLSLYIHIPWCIKKCPYCDFNSHSLKNGLPEEAYIDALLTDLQLELPNIWGRPVETIFFGGGTPSLFQAKSIDRLLSGVRSLLRLQPEAEITLEANPGTFEIEKFQGFKDAGITRLSIGVQSFNDDMLARLGRVHNGKEALTAIDTALKLFDKVNIDLMYALPNQTVQTALNDVQTAIATGVSHISAYHLTMEPNTPFGHTPPKGLPQDEAALDIEDAVHGALEGAGFIHYETSAFANLVCSAAIIELLAVRRLLGYRCGRDTAKSPILTISNAPSAVVIPTTILPPYKAIRMKQLNAKLLLLKTFHSSS